MKLKLMKLAAVCAFALAVVPTLPANAALKPEVRALVGECAQNPQKMKQTIATLSAEDQLEFLRAVNEAISKMPGSNEVKGAAFYEANRAAVTGAGKDNLKSVLAEVFATVPPEYLPVVTDSFASDLFNRSADPSVSYTDQQYIQIASNTMVKVNERMADVDNGSARATFAAVMLIKASNNTPDGLVDALVSTLPSDSQDTARNDWIPPATASGEAQSYEPLVEAAGATGTTPSSPAVIRVAGPQMLDAMLGDLNNGGSMVGDVFRSDREQPTLPVKDITLPETAVIEDIYKEDQGYQNQF